MFSQKSISNINAIPVKILKWISGKISPCLTNIINKYLSTEVFLDNLKKARVAPIPKESDTRNLKNNRPISVFSKVLKK